MGHFAFSFVFLALLFSFAFSDTDNSGCNVISNDNHEEFIIQTPGKVQVITTSGSSNHSKQEVQNLRLVPHQVLQFETEGTITGGSFSIEFCDFNVLMPGYVQYAPVSSSFNEIIVITDENNVQQVWKDFGVYKGYPVRISTDQTIENQHRKVYHINLDSCENADATDNCIVVVPLGEKYLGKTITNGKGSAWGCDFSKKTSFMSLGTTVSSVKEQIENILGVGTVSDVSRSPSNTDGSFTYNVTFSSGIADIYARLDTSKLRGDSIKGSVHQLSTGVKAGISFPESQQNWVGSFRLKFGDEITGEIYPDATKFQLESALRRLNNIGPDVAVTKSDDEWSWGVTFVNEIGDVPSLEMVSSSLRPLGTTIDTAEVVKGQAKIGGSFQLTYGNKDIEVLADATEEEMRSELESTFNLEDVSIRRTGPSRSNGYSWTISYLGDCPDDKALVNDYYISSPCDINLSVGIKTNDLLTGNDAKVKIERPIYVDLESQIDVNLVWKETSRLPETLNPSLKISSTRFNLFGKGRYIFEGYNKQDDSVAIATRYVYVDTGPPNAVAEKENATVVWPINIVQLNATASTPFEIGNDVISSYHWSLLELPEDNDDSTNKENTGIIAQPNQASTYAIGLNIPGYFFYKIEVVNSIGLPGCGQVQVGVLFAPKIDFIPDKAVPPSSVFELVCPVSGSFPMFITWTFDERINLGTGSNNTLKLYDIQEKDEGTYSCSAENAAGIAKSNTFELVVMNPPQFRRSPVSMLSFVPGKKATFTCEIVGHDMINITWEYKKAIGSTWNQIFKDDHLYSGETSEYSVSSVKEENAGFYRCVAENLAGIAVSEVATLDLLGAPKSVNLTVEPFGRWFDPESLITLSCVSDPVTGNRYSWEKDGKELQGFISTNYVISSANRSDAGAYVCVVTNDAGFLRSNSIDIDIYSKPIFSKHPISGTVNPGDSFTFSVNATGKSAILYLWTHNGVYLSHPSSFSKSLTINNIDINNAGEYKAVAYNDLGFAVSEPAVLSLRDPPSIDSHPTSVSVDPGNQVSFFCNATGSQPLSFYWVKYNSDNPQRPIRVVRGIETTGKNHAVLTISDVTNLDESKYACIASNTVADTTSKYVDLNVYDPPTIISHPNDTYVEPGHTAYFSVVALGANPLTYQWRKNGKVIQNSNNPSLTLPNVVAKSDAGAYDVRITNRLNPTPGVLSNVAMLQIATSPVITAYPVNSTICNPGEDVKLEVEFEGAPPMTFFWEKYEEKPSIKEYKRGGGQLLKTGKVTITDAAFDTIKLENISEVYEGWFVFHAANRIGNISTYPVRIRVNNPPVITTEIKKVITDPKSTIDLTCEVEADPPITSVSWVFQPFGMKGRSIIQGETNFKLQITNVQQGQEGTYYCLAVNSAGTTEKAVGSIEVRDPPSIIRLEPIKQGGFASFDPGESISLIAVAEGLEPMTYDWYRNGLLVQTSYSNKLELTVQTENDIGKFHVIIKNALGETISDLIHLDINTPAEISRLSISPETGRVIPHSPASLKCEASGSLPIYFSWQLNKVNVQNLQGNLTNFKQLDSASGNTSTLLIQEASSARYSGKYTCTAYNSAQPGGSISRPVALTVIDPPIASVDFPKDSTQYPGESKSFICRLEEGVPPFTVSWYKASYSPEDDKNGNTKKLLLTPGSKYEYHQNVTETSSTLSIQNTTENDQGLYWCQICNEAGCASSRQASLGVHDSPGIIKQNPGPADSPVTIDPGTRLKLDVTASGLEPLYFQWKVAKIPGDNLYYPVETDGFRVYYSPSNCNEANVPCSLVFESTLPEDNGLYMCTVTNELGIASSYSVNIIVNTPPELVDLDDWPAFLETACSGEHFSHSVGLRGTLPIDVSWYYSEAEPQSPEDLLSQPPLQQSKVTEHGYGTLDIRNPTKLNNGYYIFKAENSAGKFVSKVSFIRVNSGPSAAADAEGASPRHVISLPQTFTQLRGVASKSAVDFSWKLIQAPTTPKENMTDIVSLQQPESVVCDVIGLTIPGAYTFELTVTGPNGCKNSDQVTIIVNTPPVITASDQTVALPSQQVVLDATGSYDPDTDGEIVSYKWEYISRDSHGGGSDNSFIVDPYSPKTMVTGITEPGEHQIGLTVTDNEGIESYKIIFIRTVLIEFLIDDISPIRSSSCDANAIRWKVNFGNFKKQMTDEKVYLVVRKTDNVYNNYKTLAVAALKNFSLESSDLYGYNWQVGAEYQPGFVQLQIDLGGRGEIVATSELIQIQPKYFLEVTNWSACKNLVEPSSCGSGTRDRNVTCYELVSSNEGDLCTRRNREVALELCSQNQKLPHHSEICVLNSDNADCIDSGKYSWSAGEWNIEPHLHNCEELCPLMTNMVRERKVVCLNGNGQIVPDINCAPLVKPTTIDESCLPICSEKQNQITTHKITEFMKPCIESEIHSQVCLDGRTGLPLSDSESNCTYTNGKKSTQTCENIVTVGQWRSEEGSNFAIRNITCTKKTENGQSCSPEEIETANILLRKKVSASEMPTAYFFSSSNWSPCPIECNQAKQSRTVLCMDSNGKKYPDYICSQNNIPVPLSEQQCPCNKCGGNKQCGAHGSCNSELNICVCDKGWTGNNCQTSKGNCKNGVVSKSGQCCSAGILDISGKCCSSEDKLDANGQCCPSSVQLDACGVCGGNAMYIDVYGTCCSTALDAGGRCCESGLIDHCGVCDGTGLSCNLELSFDASIASLPFTDQINIPSRISRMVEEDVRNKTLLPHSKFEISSSGYISTDQSSVGRILNAGTSADQKINIKVKASPHQTNKTVSVLRSELRSAIPYTNVSVSAKGVCGNGHCEHGERCSYDSTRYGAHSCCPLDCPFPELQSCSNGCSGRGKCNMLAGECNCFPGYEGQSCESCSLDSRQAKNGECVPVSYFPKEVFFADSSASVVEVEKTQWWPLAILGVGMLALGIFFCYKKRKANGSKPKSQSIGKFSKHTVIVKPPASKKGDDFSSILLDFPQEGKHGEENFNGWLWKRSRQGIGGRHIWQQWYVILDAGKMWYVESDVPSRSQAWASKKENIVLERQSKLMERGCIDLINDVEKVEVLKKSKLGYMFSVILKDVNEADGILDDVPGFGKILNKTAYRNRNIRWMSASLEGRQDWIVELSKYVDICHEQDADTDTMEARSFSTSKEIEISLTDSDESEEPKENIEVQSTITNESSSTLDSQRLVIGSINGAIGKQVLMEGWVKVTSDKELMSKGIGKNELRDKMKPLKKVYLVLFADPHTSKHLNFYEKFSVAADGAHHFLEELMSLRIELRRVSSINYYISDSEKTKIFSIRTQNGVNVLLKTRTTHECSNWVHCLRTHLEHHFGLHLGELNPKLSTQNEDLESSLKISGELNDKTKETDVEYQEEYKHAESESDASSVAGENFQSSMSRKLSDVSIRLRKHSSSSILSNYSPILPTKSVKSIEGLQMKDKIEKETQNQENSSTENNKQTDYAYADFQKLFGIRTKSPVVTNGTNQGSSKKLKSPKIKSPTIRTDQGSLENEKEKEQFFSVV